MLLVTLNRANVASGSIYTSSYSALIIPTLVRAEFLLAVREIALFCSSSHNGIPCECCFPMTKNKNADCKILRYISDI